MISRRELLKGTAAAVPALAAPAFIARTAETLTIAAFGGEFKPLFIQHVIEPFEKKFSCKVTYDDSGGLAYFARIRAAKGAPGFDVAAQIAAPDIILGAKENLLEKITEKEVPNLKYCFKKSAELIPPYGVIQHYQYLSLLYHKDIEEPASWIDYWQPAKKYGEKVRGHVIGHSMAANPEIATYSLIMGAKAIGGSDRNLDGAWDLLKNQKPYLGFVSPTSAAAVPYIENGQAWLMPFWSSRSALYISRGLPYKIAIPKEGTFALPDCGGIPVGATNKKLAFEFFNHRLDPEIQKAFGAAYFIGPGRPDLQGLPETYVSQQVTTEQKMGSMVFIDQQYFADQQRGWIQRWQEVMAG